MEKKEWQERGAGHRGRLRDRFLEKGLAGLNDAEILELLLSFGTPRKDCKEPARQLLATFGSFAKVLEAPYSALRQVAGVGPKNGFALHFVHAAASHYLHSRLKGRDYLHSSSDVAQYLAHTMRGLKKEIFTVIFLDSSHAILHAEVMAEGTLNVNTVYPREIIRRALEHHAAAIVLAHNHPSGAMQPSVQDIQLTTALSLLCSHMQIQVLDHFIVGEDTYSFADHGLMASIQEKVRKLAAEFRR